MVKPSLRREMAQKAVAAAAGKTDGVIFHLWGKDQVIPDGTVTIPNAIGHVHRIK